MSGGSGHRPARGRVVWTGARAYSRALVGAGGVELEVLDRIKRGGTLSIAMYSSPPYALSVPPLAVPRLALNLTASRVSGGIDGERARSYAARRHSLFLTPAGEPVTWHKESPSRHLTLYFDPDLLSVGEDALPVVPTLFNASVPGLNRLVDDLIDELRAPSLLHGEAADSLGRLMLVRVVRHLRRAAIGPRALGPACLARLRDYVAAHLGDRILVADLAREVGLSPNRFALAFTQVAGLPPHRFVLAMRVERAAQLLATSTASLARIAHDCGFASQQHLSNALRRHLGTTPSRYRALNKQPNDPDVAGFPASRVRR